MASATPATITSAPMSGCREVNSSQAPRRTMIAAVNNSTLATTVISSPERHRPTHISGMNMMCARAVPGNITHGMPAAGVSGSPVEAPLAPGMYTT